MSILLAVVFHEYANADIIPNPVQAKSIVPEHPVNIQMVSEIVNVDLTKDSAFVSCTFFMHNLGPETELSVGFPVMNFYQLENDYLDPATKNKFDVFVRGSKLNKVDLYIPQKLKDEMKGYSQYRYEFEHYDDDASKPWYLWKMHFEAGEKTVIKVVYKLPNGVNKSERFFTYLLSTGAGWAGNIRDARLNVNLIGLPEDQLLEIWPKRFKIDSANHRVSWHFRNFKPTVHNDITLCYEEVKGGHDSALKSIFANTTVYLNGAKTEYFYKVKNEDIAIFRIRNSGIIAYTCSFLVDSFKRKSARLNPSVGKSLRRETVESLTKKYNFYVDNIPIDTTSFYDKLLDVDTTAVTGIRIIKHGRDERFIEITTKKATETH